MRPAHPLAAEWPVVYRVTGDTVEILRVLHTSRERPIPFH